MFKNVLILGASRGLGRALALTLHERLAPEKIHLVSRKLGLLENTAVEARASFGGSVEVSVASHDLTQDKDVETLAQNISQFDLVIYNAGGGSYGHFHKKEWKDHLWALKLNLTTPLFLCHKWLQTESNYERIFVVVGSRIAGLHPDPFATSYSASKHALVGFVGSMQKELEGRREKLLLFSPGYIDTDLLPPQAEVRKKGLKIMPPEAAALAFWRWLEKPVIWHRVLN